VLLACRRLNRLVANDTYPASQKDALLAGFTGETLVLRGMGTFAATSATSSSGVTW
jgi:hypothetical protein